MPQAVETKQQALPAQTTNMASDSAVASPTDSSDASTTRLLWHMLHLNNILLSQFGAWLSLEALYRDSTSTGLVVPTPHAPMMQAQAVMMADSCRNLDAAVEAIDRLPADREFLNKSSAVLKVFDAARKMSTVVVMIEGGINSRDDVESLRVAYYELTKLCYGDATNGGWKEAWNEVLGVGSA
ncbi:hypothetical protein LTR10_013893 [Elasticomyces elasticus]|nr:hypothetical protein LTR10_013893 [Elasticomyces elasticus]